MITNNLDEIFPQLLNLFQTGFMPHRLISDNGWINRTPMDNIRHANPLASQVTVLLDQEKAYDCIHPEYLRQTLMSFGFPPTPISCLSNLFSDTQISLSINGWLGAPITQACSL